MKDNNLRYILSAVFFCALIYSAISIFSTPEVSRLAWAASVPKAFVPPYLPQASVTKSRNSLKTGLRAPAERIDIAINAPVELDFLTRDQIMKIRAGYVLKHPELLQEGYFLYQPVFGSIIDKRPWWGIKGQFCYGPGDYSIEGPSEETRFFANPYLLLGLDEGKAFVRYETLEEGAECNPAFPQAVSLVWNAFEGNTVATYDIKGFFGEREKITSKRYAIYKEFNLVNYNARDFGYSYIYADPALSRNVGPAGNARLFSSVCVLQSFIHSGGSCGYGDGCNNESPKQPDLRFKVDSLPAVICCKLWKNRPESAQSPADFVFTIKME